MTRIAPTTAPAPVRPARTYVGPLATQNHALDSASTSGWPGARATLAATASYVGLLALATWPMARTFGSRLAGDPSDPLMHLWLMRWARTCLLEGRSPIFCPELQYPVGAAMGNFSPLQFQALLYIPLSFLTANDVLCFNAIWLFGMTTTGLGTFLLAWQAVRDRWCALLAGMLAMLAAPMLLHGRAHLELIHLGCFPLFVPSYFIPIFARVVASQRVAIIILAFWNVASTVGSVGGGFLADTKLGQHIFINHGLRAAAVIPSWPYLIAIKFEEVL